MQSEHSQPQISVQKERNIRNDLTTQTEPKSSSPYFYHNVWKLRPFELQQFEAESISQEMRQIQSEELNFRQDFQHRQLLNHHHPFYLQINDRSPKSTDPINQVEANVYLNPFLEPAQDIRPLNKQLEGLKVKKPRLNINLNNIFTQQPLKRHQNQPKQINGLLRKILPFFKKQNYFSDHEELYLRINQSLRTCKDKSYNLNSLRKTLLDTTKNQQEQQLILLIMRKFLSQNLRKQSLKKVVKNQFEYLVCLKTYSLRCSNPTLVDRMAFK